jgi:serine/threonine protein kinase/predicted Zn-dependent protease
MIGKILSHYKILERIGGGGMGIVFKAEDTKLKRPVALKFLPPAFATDPTTKERFIHEAQAASALQHNNICAIHEIDETDDGQMYIVMDYYEGETLKLKIKKGKLNIEDAVDYTIQIAQGLQKAHGKGIIHRDIKPANIMITDDGEVKILDFGLAKFRGQSKITKSGSTVGTVAYMSPEQARGEEVDHRSDIWSLGVMLYEMVTGQLPFKGDYEQALMYSILNEEPVPQTELRTDMPMELERIIIKAILKSPDERYQHADDFIADLKKLKKEMQTPEQISTQTVFDKKPNKIQLKKIVIFAGIIFFFSITFIILKPSIFQEEIISEPIPIAVISFENQTGDKTYDYLKIAIPNLLITNLEQSKYLKVTTWERMHDLLNQLGKKDVEIIDKELGFELCQVERIDAIVLGSFTKAGEIFATDLKVLDVNTKEILRSANSRGKGESSILETQIDELSKEVSRGIGLSDSKFIENHRPVTEVTTSSLEAYRFYLRAREEDNKHYWSLSRNFFQKALELDSTFAMAYFGLAVSCQMLRDYNTMYKSFDKAMHFSQNVTEREQLYIQGHYTWFIKGDTNEAINIFKQLVTKYPRDKLAHYTLGKFYEMEKGMFAEAIHELKKVIELDPTFEKAFNHLGYAYSGLGDYSKAIFYLKKYADISPGHADPFDSMGDVYFEMGKFDEAIAKYNKAINIESNFGSGKMIAYCYALKEDYSNVIKWIDHYTFHASSPGVKADGYLWKGVYQYLLGQHKQCFTQLDYADTIYEDINNNRARASLDRTRGWIYYELKKYEKSDNYFQKWFEYVKKDDAKNLIFFSAYYNFARGLTDLQKGMIDSTKSRIALISSAIPYLGLEEKEQITFFYHWLNCELLVAQDLFKEAKIFCEKISSFEPPVQLFRFRILTYNLPFSKDFQARVYYKNRELNKALNEYEQLTIVIEDRSDRLLINPLYHYRFARLYEEEGCIDKAIKEYKKFLEIWKDADEDLQEFTDAKARLARLTEKK